MLYNPQCNSSYGYRVQVITTQPKNIKEKIPAILLVRWLSCAPVEELGSNPSGTDLFLKDIIERSGALVMRVEKPGLGDSEGPPCRDVSFKEEFAAHRAALAYLKTIPDVDTNNIVILGLSNGGGYAPEVGNGHNIKGYAIMGRLGKNLV